MYKPRNRHWISSKHVLRYLRGTIFYGLKYASIGGVMLLGYVESHWGGSIVDGKGTSRFFLSWDQL